MSAGVVGSAINRSAAIRVNWMCSLLLHASALGSAIPNNASQHNTHRMMISLAGA
jgi:hypothetical protein